MAEKKLPAAWGIYQTYTYTLLAYLGHHSEISMFEPIWGHLIQKWQLHRMVLSLLFLDEKNAKFTRHSSKIHHLLMQIIKKNGGSCQLSLFLARRLCLVIHCACIFAWSNILCLYIIQYKSYIYTSILDIFICQIHIFDTHHQSILSPPKKNDLLFQATFKVGISNRDDATPNGAS